METYMGHEPKYWLELEKRIKSIENGETKISDLLTEIVKLKGALAFVRSRLNQMLTVLD